MINGFYHHENTRKVKGRKIEIRTYVQYEYMYHAINQTFKKETGTNGGVYGEWRLLRSKWRRRGGGGSAGAAAAEDGGSSARGGGARRDNAARFSAAAAASASYLEYI